MSIGSCSSGPPFSLAMMKTLGIESPAAPGAAAPGQSPPRAEAPGGGPAAGSAAEAAGGAPLQKVAPVAAGAEAGADLGVAKTIPRGSFVDLKV